MITRASALALVNYRLPRDRIVVVLEQKIFIYNFAHLKLLHQIETIANPKGLCAVSQTASSMVLVCPGLQKGQVRVEHYTLKKTKFINAHDSRISCFALTMDGQLLAMASTKGTLVRIYNTVDETLLQEVDGNFLDRAMNSKQRNMYTSVLVHASWCPFSHKARSTFEVLSSMFPQIEHLAIEQSSADPSFMSRYGIHSLPAILMVNQTSSARYHGQKDLLSLVKFYKETTGIAPVQYFTKDHPISYESWPKMVVQSWNGSSAKEIITKEPYLAFSVLFLFLRILLLILPEVISFLKTFWVSYVPHLNLDIFGDTRLTFGRLLHMIDLKRVWTKLRLCKTRNFHESAKNARVWASSLASVSVGETSSARS